jgi:Icc-related predicted phosphoesterase
VRILLVSDLHYTLKQFDWVHSVAGDFDMVVIAGDHLDIAAVADSDAQIVVILKYLDRLRGKTRLLVSSGNHDLTRLDASGEKVARWLAKARRMGIPIDGDALEIDGTLFTICPYWDGPVGRATVGELLARAAALPKRRWVWIYHAPPDRSRVSWIGKRHLGDAVLSEWIEEYQPDMVLTGHIHQSPFRRGGSWVDRHGATWVFNAGRQIGPCPTHVILDTEAMTAAWFSLAGNQEVGLHEQVPQPLPELNL